MEWGCCSAWLFPFAMHKHAHAHTDFGVGYQLGWRENPIALVGVTPAGSELSSVETGESQVVSGLKSTFNFPSTSAVALEFGDGDSASAVWLLPVLCWQGGNQHLTLPLPSFTPKEICCSSLG